MVIKKKRYCRKGWWLDAKNGSSEGVVMFSSGRVFLLEIFKNMYFRR
jgi:hypothetical protein